MPSSHLLLTSLPPSSKSTLFPYTTLFRSLYLEAAISPLGFHGRAAVGPLIDAAHRRHIAVVAWMYPYLYDIDVTARSEEHTSELQSHSDLVCRLLLEKKKI